MVGIFWGDTGRMIKTFSVTSVIRWVNFPDELVDEVDEDWAKDTRNAKGVFEFTYPGRGPWQRFELYYLFYVRGNPPSLHTFNAVLLQPLNRTVHKYLVRRKGERENTD